MSIITVYILTCQECGAEEQDIRQNWSGEKKCKKCKSSSLDLGAASQFDTETQKIVPYVEEKWDDDPIMGSREE